MDTPITGTIDLSRRRFCRAVLLGATAAVTLPYAFPSILRAASPAPATSSADRKREFLRFWGITVTPNDEIGNKCHPAIRGLGANAWNNMFYLIPQLAMAECEPGSVKTLSKATQGILRGTLRFINEMKDCSDFGMNAVLRMLYLYPKSALLGERLNELKRAVLDFVYWYDEPVQHNGVMFTENHQMLFSTAELLAGQLYPDEEFTRVKQPGRWRVKRGRERVLRWLDWRTRFGFSEWLSGHYYEEDLVPLFNLQQFAEDKEISERAGDVLNLMLFEMAAHSHRGVFNVTQGRVYSANLLRPKMSFTSPIAYLCWGRGWFDKRLSMSAISLATSPFEPAKLIRDIALDEPAELEIAQRSSLVYADLAEQHLDPADPANLPLIHSTGLWAERRCLEAAATLLPAENRIGQEMRDRLKSVRKRPAGQADTDSGLPYALPRVHPYTFRTPQFMLSCAQDWRKGQRGYQQHIWTAVLDEEAQVFTTNPHSDKNRVDRWAGNGVMPKAVAHRNVLICLYRVPADKTLAAETHAWFPRFAFDEVIEQGGWVFGRKGEGYVALRSQRPANWAPPEPEFFERYQYRGNSTASNPKADGPYEYLAPGANNAWICEMGNPAMHKSFAQFVARIAAAMVQGDDGKLRYESPSAGILETGWDLPLTINGKAVDIHPPERYRSPYCTAAFGSTEYKIVRGSEQITIGRRG